MGGRIELDVEEDAHLQDCRACASQWHDAAARRDLIALATYRQLIRKPCRRAARPPTSFLTRLVTPSACGVRLRRDHADDRRATRRVWSAGVLAAFDLWPTPSAS